MKPSEIIKEVSRMELSDKLLLVEDIWDSIALSHSVLPLPEWQKHELDRRYGEYKEGKLDLYEWKKLHSMVRESNQ